MPATLVRHIGWAGLTVLAAAGLWRALAVPELGALVWHMRAINAGAVWLVAAFLIAETRWLYNTPLPAAMIALAVGIWWAIWQSPWPWALAWWAVQLALIIGWAASWLDAWLLMERWRCYLSASMTAICTVMLLGGAVARVLTMQPLDPMSPAIKRQSTIDIATGFGGAEIFLMLVVMAVLCAICFCWRGARDE